MDLFEHSRKEQIKQEAPLAARMRPRTLDEFAGQDHIVGQGRLLRRAIAADRIFSSLIFWGPPGTGKTTLAMIISHTTRSHFEVLSAVMAGVKDIRRVVSEAKDRRGMYGRRTILLVDEIHRFNRVQQDALLPHVEEGTIILIGSTTENPYFEVVGPLLSRSRVFQFKPLGDEEIAALLRRALSDPERGYGQREIKLDPDALDHLVHIAGGDARTALNALELAVESTPPNEQGLIHITLRVAEESIQRRAVRYDRAGDEHYDTISAFIKSVRGSDPDAALYWLAKMVAAGEDPRFILRRLYILAAEDIGLADPQAIVVVNACAEAFEWVGLPEGQYHLSLATLYLATAPKSNSAGAYWGALAHVEEHGTAPVPLPLRDKSDRFQGTLREHYKQTLGEHEGYKYPHSYPTGWVEQQYLPEGVEETWFKPKGHGYESVIRRRLRRMRGEEEETGSGE
ncbi:MAG: AAA family ATPase [Anaerolineae bacterium]|jgi:putative ATPase